MAGSAPKRSFRLRNGSLLDVFAMLALFALPSAWIAPGGPGGPGGPTTARIILSGAAVAVLMCWAWREVKLLHDAGR
jgi:hypothetical protein